MRWSIQVVHVCFASDADIASANPETPGQRQCLLRTFPEFSSPRPIAIHANKRCCYAHKVRHFVGASGSSASPHARPPEGHRSDSNGDIERARLSPLWSIADIATGQRSVRFTPESEHAQA